MSKNNSSNTTSSGVGFAGLLQIAFIVLKLIGVIDWSWVWVLSPTWISAILVTVVLLVVFIILFVKNMKGEWLNGRNKN